MNNNIYQQQRENDIVDSLDALLGAVVYLRDLCQENIDSKDGRIIHVNYYIELAITHVDKLRKPK